MFQILDLNHLTIVIRDVAASRCLCQTESGSSALGKTK